MHDLARDVLDADLRWRDPTAHRRMRRRILTDITTQLLATTGRHQQDLLFDSKFMHRGNDPSNPGDWSAVGLVGIEPLRPRDRAAVLEMTARHEGAESARWAEFWLDRQPEAFSAFRAGDELNGFACYLDLARATAADRDADPATRGVWRYVERDPELGPEDSITFVRLIMDAEHHQQPSLGFNHRSALAGLNFFANTRLAWDFAAVRAPHDLGREFAYFDYVPVPEIDYVIGGHTYEVIGRHWRHRPLATWTRLMGQRALAQSEHRPDDAGGGLARPEFDAAVKAALRHLTRPALLAGNALLGTRLAGRADGTQAAARIAARVRAAAQDLASDPRDRKLFDAVDRTYLRPAPSQERAAAALGLPFSTYRRHLTRGISRVAGALWLEAYPPGAET